MRKTFSIILSLFFSTAMIAQQGTDLFFSEYLEGSSQNKALEIFNPTSDTINLDNYKIARFMNGFTTSEELPIQLNNGSNVIAPYSTIVITNGQIEENEYGQIDPELYALADMTGPGVYPSPMYFTGNDAIALLKGDQELVDLIGKIGQNPGDGWCDDESLDYQAGDQYWLSWTSNNTMIRKSSVYSGVQDNPAFFNPALEWDTLPNNDWSDLGQHSYLYTTFATFQVVDENGSVANAQINISDEQLITDENGFDSIPLLSGSYPFVVSRAGYEQYNSTLEMMENDTTVLVELTQSNVYTITFTVNDIDGLPIPNASLFVGGESFVTNSAGNTTVMLGNGTWAYEVSASEYQTVNQQIIVDGEQTTEIVVLPPVVYSFDVYVFSGIDPLANALVEMNGETGTTDVDGIYTFMLSDGNYPLTISKEGYDSYATEIVIDGEPSSISVELFRFFEVQFQVLHASQPIEGAQIIIDTLERYTDEQGIATFELMNGLYNYDVVTDEFTTQSGSIDVSGSDVEKVINFTGIQEFGTTFNLYPNPTTSKVVIASEGNAVATIYNSTGQIIDIKHINGELTYSFTKPGIYLVKLSDNQATEIVKVIVE